MATSSIRKSKACTRVCTRRKISRMWAFIERVWPMETILAFTSLHFSSQQLSTWASTSRLHLQTEWLWHLRESSVWGSRISRLLSHAQSQNKASTCVSTLSMWLPRLLGRLAMKFSSRWDPSQTRHPSDSQTLLRYMWRLPYHKTTSSTSSSRGSLSKILRLETWQMCSSYPTRTSWASWRTTPSTSLSRASCQWTAM